jgi:ElaB/YqjD/DUF883 family membrane-anchored ribosome-binding protein
MQNSANSPVTNGQGSGPSALSKTASAISVSGVSREFQSFLADIEDLIKETTSLTGEELAHARARLNARVATAKASVEGMGDNIVQRAKQSATVTNEYVHEQPWKALGASTAIAFLLAIARRS